MTNADALPVTFSAPMKASSVEPAHFEFLLNNGSVTRAICVTPLPASEENEMQTFATVGYYGDGWKDSVWPVHLKITGDSLFADGSSAKGLEFDISAEQRYATGTPYLVQVSERLTDFLLILVC